jgi:hypothetical protein
MSPPEFFRDNSCLPGLRLCRSILHLNRITNDLQTGLDRGLLFQTFYKGATLEEYRTAVRKKK